MSPCVECNKTIFVAQNLHSARKGLSFLGLARNLAKTEKPLNQIFYSGEIRVNSLIFYPYILLQEKWLNINAWVLDLHPIMAIYHYFSTHWPVDEFLLYFFFTADQATL